MSIHSPRMVTVENPIRQIVMIRPETGGVAYCRAILRNGAPGARNHRD